MMEREMAGDNGGSVALKNAGILKSAGMRRRLAVGLLGSTMLGSMIPCCAALLSPPQAHAQTQQAGQAVQFSIPAQPLASAVDAFSRVTGWQVGYSSQIARSIRTRAVSGTMTPAQALATMLAGTGVHASTTGPASVALVSRAEASGGDVADDGSLVLDTITVEGQIESAWDPVNGFLATRSATGTKTDTPIIETPQSISVVGAPEIRQRGVQNLSEALGYVAGVGTSEGYQNDNESYMIRGFQASAATGSMYRDGTKFSINVYNAPQEPYGLERIEVLKGASSVLYGTSAPGGIINTVTKRPPLTPLRELGVEYGSFEHKQIFGDFGGPIDADGKFSYRLTGLFRDSDTFKDYSANDRAFIAPALTWRPLETTSLTILGEYQKDKTTPIYGLPAKGTVQPNVNGRFSRSLFTGEPGFDENDQTRWSFGYLLDHDFSDALKLRSGARYFRAIAHRPAIFLGTLQPDERTITRIANRSIDHSHGFVADQSLQYKWTVGNIVNTSLIGLDYTYQWHEQRVQQKPFTSLDLFAPVYTGFVGLIPTTRIARSRKEQVGLYVQNQAKINDKLVLLLGGRQDWASYDNLANKLTSPLYQKNTADAFTGRAGAVYLFDNGLAPYVSFSQSFEPLAGSDRSGASFKPTEGEQYEAGLRYQPPGTDVMFTAAAYELTQTNVSVTDPVDPNYSVQQGKVRSRGFEFEARGRIGESWNIAAAYAYTDSRTIRSSPLTPELDGKRTGNVPYNQVSLWADYDFAALGVPGLNVGAGLRYIGERAGMWIDAKVPEVTLVDAAISYTKDDWRVALNATNLFDRTYVASCTYGCFYGEPLKVGVSVSKRW